MPVVDVADFPSTGPLLGLDPGTKTVGVASCDALRMIASPVETIPKGRKLAPVLDRLFHLYDDRKAVGLVVGLPLNMDGSENPVTPKARKFGNRLNGRYNLPVHMVDERLTTRDARTELYNAGVTESRHKPVLDKLAAQSILQTFLTEHIKQQTGPERESD